MKYGVYVEIDTNEWMWDSGTDQISPAMPPLVFNTREEAEERAKRWNTGTVQPLPEQMQEYWRQYEQERAKRIAENVPPVLKDYDVMHVDPDKRPWTYDCSGNKVVKTEDGEPDYTTIWNKDDLRKEKP